MKPLFSPQLPRLPRRPIDAHKNSAGSVCVIGGSYGMAGAAALAASGAFATGAGYVRVVCPREIYPILATLVPSAVFVPLESPAGSYAPEEIEKALAAANACNACVIGPGLGESAAAKQILVSVLGAVLKPMVVDASALTLSAAKQQLPRAGGRPWVLTPHPGEAARLLDTTALAVQADRPAAVTGLATAFGCVAVLKGARTLVCDGHRLYENTSGNAGMAKAGSGDVLAGAITALIAQGLDAFDAACLGVYLHGRAGDKAAQARGRAVSASDIAGVLPEVLGDYEGGSFEKGRTP